MTDELRDLLRAELAAMEGRLTGAIDKRFDRIETRLGAVEAKVDNIAIKVEGAPLVGRATTVLQQEVRMLRSAFNDFALTNATKGEIESLHTEVNRVHVDYQELGTRLLTVERRLQELIDTRSK